jgi:Flp pilus assembly protein TadD
MLLGMLRGLFHDSPLSTRRPGQKALARGAARSAPAPLKEADLRRTLELLPNSAEAHNTLGVFLRDARRLPEAETAFRQAINLQADHLVAHYNLGAVLYETNRPWEAEGAYRRALALLPNFVECHNNLGVVLMDTERLAEAEAAFRRALELKPEFAEAQKNLDLVVAKMKDLLEIEAQRRRAVALMPDSAATHNELGVALQSTQRLAEAEAAFRRAIELEEGNVVALYNLGVILASTGRHWEAEAAYRKALQYHPRCVEALNNLGLLLVNARRMPEAEATLRRVLELDPNCVGAHASLGVALLNAMRPAEAEAALRRALALDSEYEVAKGHLGLAVKEARRLSEAEAVCRRDVDLKPGCAASRYKLGLTQMSLAELDAAVASFKQVLVIEPNHVGAYNNLGVALSRQGQLEGALASYLQAIAIRPDFALAMANLGAAYLASKQPEQALRWNRAALAIEPEQVEANQNIAMILQQTGNTDEAREHLDRASRAQGLEIQYAATPTRTVLLLFTTVIGNVPTTEFLFPTTINTRVQWTIGSARDDLTDYLPHYDLVFNAMGDADMVGDSTDPVSRFIPMCTKPILNPPDKVARTARNNLPALLDGIDNVVVPAVWRFAHSADWDESVVAQLPLLVRPAGSHGGTGLELVRTAAELAQRRAAQTGPVYVSRFVDFRSADSCFRKYRMIFIDRNPYPYHLAIAPEWMVHYYTAGMESSPWKVEEEKAFLENPEAALGPAGIQAIKSIGARLDLDYAGIDFSVMADKRLLVFEANASMLVHPEDLSGPLKHKNRYVFQIQHAFEEMLQRVEAANSAPR